MSFSFTLLNATPGCMDDAACNFDSNATSDDGSCEYANTIICYQDADGDGFHEGVVLSNAKKIHSGCNASCSDLGSEWSEGFGDGFSAVRPPLIPEVQAVTGNEKVLLMWDNKAESSIDPFTSYSDFEGYRVYRSSDGGVTWGDSSDDRIFNYYGDFVGWKPYAQFDLIEESDSLHCIYGNGYYGQSGERCYSLAYATADVRSALLEDSDVIVKGDSVYLPKYIRGSCPTGQLHDDEHDADDVHAGQDDCFNGGYLSDYDPMASWIDLGRNDSLKRTFIDTNVLDGVEYTYAVTAYDTGLKTFKVNHLNTDTNASSDENYCDGNDSHCSGSDFYCDGDDSYCSDCSPLFADQCGNITTSGECGGFTGGTWNVVEYSDSTNCVDNSHQWTESVYLTESVCENNNYEWVVVEYDDESSCESVDLDGDGAPDHEWKVVHFVPDTTWSSWNPGKFLGVDYSDIDPLWGYASLASPLTFESFTDFNSNGVCDYEPFVDLDSSDANANGICDQSGDWSTRCSDDLDDCSNVAVVVSGYKASNITFPEDTPELEFIVPDSNNKGNGERLYNIVNEYDLIDAVLRFEINAGLDPESFGDISGSFATLDPSLFIYEVINDTNFTPKTVGVSHIVAGLSSNAIDSLIGLPGASYNSDSSEIILPEYKLEDFQLTYIDDPLYQSHFTDWFDGIQFRFDNGPNKINDVLSLVEIKEITYYGSDSTLNADLMSIMMVGSNSTIKMKYNSASDIAKRPMYRYRIDFSTTSVLDTAKYGVGRKCEQYAGYPSNSHTLLPFKITNITNGLPVEISHVDNGTQDGAVQYDELTQGCTTACNSSDLICIEGSCVDKIGDSDCSWQRNEILQLTDVVYTDQTGPSGDLDILFDIKIDFSRIPYMIKHVPNYFQRLANDDIEWEAEKSYGIGDKVLYDGMLFEAKGLMPDGTIPTSWYDDDSDIDMDGTGNDNPWKMLYPWDDGDFIIIEPYGWYQDGDAWVADLSIIGQLDENSKDDLNDLSVVPNPYIVNSNYFNESPGNNLIRFTRLPDKCTISIYTISGEFVTTIKHDDPFDGNEFWDLRNGRGDQIAPGLYIYVVETPSGDKKVDKFAVVR